MLVLHQFPAPVLKWIQFRNSTVPKLSSSLVQQTQMMPDISHVTRIKKVSSPLPIQTFLHDHIVVSVLAKLWRSSNVIIHHFGPMSYLIGVISFKFQVCSISLHLLKQTRMSVCAQYQYVHKKISAVDENFQQVKRTQWLLNQEIQWKGKSQ